MKNLDDELGRRIVKTRKKKLYNAIPELWPIGGRNT
jgi:hypothetical protein